MVSSFSVVGIGYYSRRLFGGSKSDIGVLLGDKIEQHPFVFAKRTDLASVGAHRRVVFKLHTLLGCKTIKSVGDTACEIERDDSVPQSHQSRANEAVIV